MELRCYTNANECKFVIEMIDSFEKLLKYNLPTYGSITSALLYKSSVGSHSKATVTIEGYVSYIYFINYNEKYPEFPTPEQKEKINAIWDALGHPEKKLR